MHTNVSDAEMFKNYHNKSTPNSALYNCDSSGWLQEFYYYFWSFWHYLCYYAVTKGLTNQQEIQAPQLKMLYIQHLIEDQRI